MKFINLFTALLLFVVFTACNEEQTKPEGKSGSDKIAEEEKGDDNNEAESSEIPDSCSFRTQTIGGWGASPAGNNPGAYLHENFSEAFSNGLTVGCNHELSFTSAQAVTDYLPDGGNSEALSESHTNPTGLNNTFASQVVALSVSVGFDNAIEDYSASNAQLENLVISEGDFAGSTVSEVLGYAAQELGGCDTPYSINELNTVITNINENYVDGKENNGFLECPDQSSDDDGSGDDNNDDGDDGSDDNNDGGDLNG